MAALFFLYLVRGILLPFILAYLIATLLEPGIKKLRLRGLSRGMSVGLVSLVFFGAVIGSGILLTPIISGQLGSLRDKVTDYSDQLAIQNRDDNFFVSWNPVIQAKQRTETNQIDLIIEDNKALLMRLGMPTTRKALIERYVEPHKAELSQSVTSFFNGFLGVASSMASKLLFLLLTPLIVIFILMDLEQFKRRSAGWIPPSIRDQVLEILEDIGQVFVKYLRGVTITIVLYSLCASVVLTLFGAPYSILLGVLFGAFYLIPYIGPLMSYSVLFVTTGLAGKQEGLLFKMDSPWAFAMVLVLCFAVYSTVFDQIVYPQLVGRSVGLNPVVSMFVILSGGALFGLIGMVFAFPLAASIKVILDRLLKFTSKQQDSLGLASVPIRHKTG